MPKNVQTIAQLHSSHTLAKECSKFSKLGFYSMWSKNFQILKLDLEKGEEPNCQHPLDHRKSKIIPEKHLLWFTDDTTLDGVDPNKLRKILQVMGIPDHLTCLLRNLYASQEATVRTRHGTTDWFKVGKECVKASYCHPAYLAYMQSHAKCQAGWSTSWNQDCWGKYQ